jgi:DNA-binding phage protein
MNLVDFMTKDKFVVVTGDLKSSRRLKNRTKIQEHLKNALKNINNTFKENIVAKFIIVGGDGFQGMLSSPECMFELYYQLFEQIDHKFYAGVGIGSIITDMSSVISEMDGEGFYRSSNALNEAKKSKKWVVFKGDSSIDNIVSSSWNLMADVMWHWTKRQKEVVMLYRREANVNSIANNLGVTDKAIYKVLSSSKYKTLKTVEDSLKDLLYQKWLKIKSRPKKVEKGV